MTAPADPDPRRYYTETIPAEFNRALAEQADRGEAGRRVYDGMRAVNATIAIEVRGAEPAHYFLDIAGGRMRATDAPAQAPFLSLVLDLAAFRTLASEAGGSLTALLGALAGLGGDMKLTRKRVRDLEEVAGLIRFEVTGEGGFWLLTHLGTQPRPEQPDATVCMSAESYRALRRGELEPQRAFLEDAIQVEGDMHKVLQLAFAAVAPD